MDYEIHMRITQKIKIRSIAPLEIQNSCTVVKIKWHTCRFAARFKSRLSSDRDKNDIKDG